MLHVPWVKPSEARLHQEFRLDPHTVFLMHLNEGIGAVANDASIHRNNGAITLATWGAGRIGNGLRFNGATDYMTVADSPTFDGWTEMTVKFWMRPATIAAGSRRIVNRANLWFVRQQGAEIAFYINAGAIYFATVTSPLTVGGWSYVSCTYDGSIAYINVGGVRLVSSAVATLIPVGGDPIVIGRFDPVPGEYYEGDLDELHVLTRALSYNEEIAHFNSSPLARQL